MTDQLLQKPKDPLAPYRGRHRNLCAGCDFADMDNNLQKVSICRNCVVKDSQRQEVEPESEEAY